MKTKILIICYLLLAACSSKEDVPDEIIPEEGMVSLLLDIYLAEGKVSDLRVTRDSSISIFKVYEKELFKKHQINSENYRKSISYYYDHPIKLETIYEAVLDSLNLKQEKLREKRDAGDNSEEDGEETNEK